MWDVLVVGAGMAGLVAARRLTQRGFRVLVLEKEKRVGGRVYTQQWGDFTWDAGTQFITSRYRNTLKLLGELGLRRQLVPIKPHLGIFNDQGFQRGNLRNPFYLGGGSGLSRCHRLRLLQLLLEAIFTGTAARNSTQRWSGLDNQDLQSWANERLGRWATENLLEAVTAALYFTDSKEQGSALFRYTLAELGFLQLYTLAGGLSGLPQTVARELNVLRECEVVRVVPRFSGVEVWVSGQCQPLKGRAVVLALPAPQVLNLLDQPELTLGEVASLLRQTRYGQAYVTALPLAEPVEEQVFGVAVAPSMKLDVGAMLFEGRKESARVPAQRECAVLMSRRLPRDAQDALKLVQQANHLYEDLGSKQIHQQSQQWPQAVACFPPGRLKQLSPYAGAFTKPPIYLCGDYWLGPSLECAVTSGLRVAQSI